MTGGLKAVASTRSRNSRQNRRTAKAVRHNAMNARQAIELSVSGPMPLGGLHTYQEEIVNALAPIVASRGPPP